MQNNGYGSFLPRWKNSYLFTLTKTVNTFLPITGASKFYNVRYLSKKLLVHFLNAKYDLGHCRVW